MKEMLDGLFEREIDASRISWLAEVMGNYRRMKMVLLCLVVVSISTLFGHNQIICITDIHRNSLQIWESDDPLLRGETCFVVKHDRRH